MATAFDRKIQVKIIQPGMDTYTGYIRGERFVDGKSFQPISVRDALRLAASCAVADMDGNQISPNTYVFDDADKITAADVMPKVEEILEVPVAEEMPEEVEEVEDEVVDFYDPDDVMDEVRVWSREELEAIADNEGINGLRDIGDLLGVKERSIDGLIDQIIKTQADADKLAGED